MKPLPDPFTPLTPKTINQLYHKRLESFTVKGDVSEIQQAHRQGKHPGQIQTVVTFPGGKQGYVIFKPETIEGLEKWNIAARYWLNLCDLRHLQIKYIEVLPLADRNREKQSEATEIKAEIITLYNSLFGEPEPQKTDIEKPLLTGETLETVYAILKDYFSKTDQSHFKRFLAGVKPPEPITFKSEGIKFADAFKRLFEANFITGWQKKEIQTFIRENIRFVYRGEIKEFKPKQIENYVSSVYHECKNPLIIVVSGQIVKSEKPNRKANHSIF